MPRTLIVLTAIALGSLSFVAHAQDGGSPGLDSGEIESLAFTRNAGSPASAAGDTRRVTVDNRMPRDSRMPVSELRMTRDAPWLHAFDHARDLIDTPTSN